MECCILVMDLQFLFSQVPMFAYWRTLIVENSLQFLELDAAMAGSFGSFSVIASWKKENNVHSHWKTLLESHRPQGIFWQINSWPQWQTLSGGEWPASSVDASCCLGELQLVPKHRSTVFRWKLIDFRANSTFLQIQTRLHLTILPVQGYKFCAEMVLRCIF